jgi:hypothetical protein
MSFDFLFTPVEHLDHLITGLFEGAPLVMPRRCSCSAFR